MQKKRPFERAFLPARIIRSRARHWYYRAIWGQYCPDPKQITWIKTSSIAWKKEPIYGDSRRLGTTITGGDWDLLARSDIVDYDHAGPTVEGLIRVEEFQLYKAIGQMIQHGVEWQNTDVYRNRLYSQIRSLEKLESEGRKIEDLIVSIRERGVVPQSVLRPNRSRIREWLLPSVYGEIRVAIGRAGDIFLEDGVHRFFIAKALGISKIPVRVILRHERWQETRARCMKESERGSVFGKGPVEDHPDLVFGGRA